MSRPGALLYTTIDSPLGELLLLGDGIALRGLYMQRGRKPATVLSGWRRGPESFLETGTQLDEYFAGRRTSFDLPLQLIGTPFQLRVWEALQGIGYGETVSYGELARRVGRPRAARAVGAANGSNRSDRRPVPSPDRSEGSADQAMPAEWRESDRCSTWRTSAPRFAAT